jgi:hypothetical protein
MTIGTPTIEVTKDSIPSEERIVLDTMLFKKLLEEEPLKGDFNDLAFEYGTKIGLIIDNPENETIRKLIMEHSYEEAAEEVMKLLKK